VKLFGGGVPGGRLGIMLLAIWLILTGILGLQILNLPRSDLVTALLAIAAGVLLLMGR
jgi:hypothetical protein